MPARKHYLYRLYDSADVLLYVGITADPGIRLKQHHKTKSWAKDIAFAEIVACKSIEEAQHREKRDIADRAPLHNIRRGTGGNSEATEPATPHRNVRYEPTPIYDDVQEQQLYITEAEACDILQVAIPSLRFWRYTDVGPRYYKVGRKVLYTREDCFAYIRASAVVPSRPHGRAA